jgi:acylglycerol lipase
LATYRQHAEGEPIAVIFMFHGLNSHIGHGAHLAQYFSKEGLITVGFDYRGFGRSQGMQGYIDNL